MQCLVAQSCPTLCHPWKTVACWAPLLMGFLQARILEWVAMPSSRKTAIENTEWKTKKRKRYQLIQKKAAQEK